MDYELLVQLKEAGFPLQVHLEPSTKDSCLVDDVVYDFPILEDLIEAIDKDTLVLWTYGGKFYTGLRLSLKGNGEFVTDTHTLTIYYEDYEIGDSYEEALSKLWLKLNPCST